MYYDDQAHTSEGTVYDINPYTYIQNIGNMDFPDRKKEMREETSLNNNKNKSLLENVYQGS